MKAVAKAYADMDNIAGVVTDKQQFEAEFSKQFLSLNLGVASIPKLKNYNKLESWFASALGWRSALWDYASLKPTEAGAIQNLLMTNARVAANSITLMASYKSLPEIKSLYNALKTSLYHLPETQIQELLHDHIVVGQYPKLQNVFDSPVLHHQLDLRYQAHISKLLDLGVSASDIADLDNLAGKISGNLDAARMTAGHYGMDIPQLKNGGYFPVHAKDEIANVLSKKAETALGGTDSHFDTAEFLKKSRASAVPAALDFDKTAKVLGLSPLDLAFHMSQPGLISDLLSSKFSPAQLDKLYENGTLAQVPALTDDLTDFFSNKLGLPIDGLGEAIQLDPVKAISDYNAALARGIENSSFVKTALDTGVKEGWLLGEDQWRALSTKDKQNFTQLGSNSLLQQIFTSTNVRETIAEAYIHRTVADQITSVWNMNRDLTKLGLIAQGFRNIVGVTNVMKRGFLMASGGLPFLTRTFLRDMVGLHAATGGTGILGFANAITDVARVIASKSLDSLDNTARWTIGGTKVSLRNAYEYTFLTRSTNVDAGVGDKIGEGQWQKFLDKLDPDTFKRFLKWQQYYHEQFGSPVTGKVGVGLSYAKEMLSDAFSGAYEQLAAANQFIEFSHRWAAVKTILDNPKVAGKASWSSMEEAIKYTDEYFGLHTAPGTLGRQVGQYGIPFATFAIQAPGSALRAALRNPIRYGRIMMLYAQAQSQSDTSHFTDGELSSWQKNSYNIFLGRTPDGSVFSINPGNVDFYLENTQWMKENFGAIMRTAGVDAGSTNDIIDSKIDRAADFSKALQSLGSKFYFTKLIQDVFTDTNPTTGEKLSNVPKQDTILGVPLPSKLRIALTELLPILGGLDNKLLPQALVGSAPVSDAEGKVVKPGVPSVFGAIPGALGGHLRKNEVDPSINPGTWVVSNWLGLHATLFNPQSNLFRNYNDLRERDSEIKSAVENINRVLMQEPDRVDKETLLQQRTHLRQIQGLVEINQMLIDSIAKKKGYTDRQALEYVRKLSGSALNEYSEPVTIEYLKNLMKQPSSQPGSAP